jgi:hypothetical protein
MKYLIAKDGKYMTSVFYGGAFEAEAPNNPAVYRYTIKQVAEDVAAQLGASVHVYPNKRIGEANKTISKCED